MKPFIAFLLLPACLVSAAVGLGGKVPMPGAPIRRDPEDPELMSLAFEGVGKLNAGLDSSFSYVPVKILSATSQIVAGSRKELVVLFAESVCASGEEVTAEKCPVKEEPGDYLKCGVSVFEQPWNNIRNVEVSAEEDCERLSQEAVEALLQDKDEEEEEEEPKKVGGLEKLDNAEEFLGLAFETAVELNKKANSIFSYVPVKVVEAYEQVVAGKNTVLDVLFAQSECRNNGEEVELSAENCPVRSELSHYLKCRVSVWTKAWQPDFKRITANSEDCEQLSKADGEELLGKERKSGGIAHVKLYKVADRIQRTLHFLDANEKFVWNAFVSFTNKFKKAYAGGKREIVRRFKNFKNNLKLIKLMQHFEKGTATYGVTQFTDMSPAEFRSVMHPKVWKDTGYPTTLAETPSGPAPDSWDWRDHGAVSAVKNQGFCGSCWAFSTTGNIEGQWAIHKKKLLSLSEQELVDCDKLDEGCNGGLPSNAYKEIMRLGGLETEKEYPYAGHGESCELKKREIDAYINGSVKISSDEEAMKLWLYHNGPISIGINAFMMQFYLGGIAHPWRIFCNPKKLDHGVLIVGYGEESGKPYWIVKNSWGTWWGRRGYYYVYRGDGVCGLNTMCTSAIVR